MRAHWFINLHRLYQELVQLLGFHQRSKLHSNRHRLLTFISNSCHWHRFSTTNSHLCVQIQQWQQGVSDVPSAIQVPPFEPSVASSSYVSAATTFTPPPPQIQSASAAGNVPAITSVSEPTNLHQQISSRITATTTATTSTIPGIYFIRLIMINDECDLIENL